MSQTELKFTQPEYRPGMTIQQRFELFSSLNPWIYKRLCELARKANKNGHSRIGMTTLWEVLRWDSYEQVFDPTSGFKLNDHFTSRYARKIMENEPDLKGIFETRKLTAV
jgi:hypothetical protein